MKEFFLLLAMCATFFCNAQQKELDSLLNELKKHPQEDTSKINLLLEAAYNYQNISPVAGVKTAMHALELAKKNRLNDYVARGYLMLAENYQNLGKDSIAINFCNQALVIKKQLKDWSGIASLYQIIGVSYFNFSDYYKAIGYQEKALAIQQKLNNQVKQADILNSLGVNYKFLANFPKALEYFQRAITIWEKTGHIELTAYALTNMGLIYNDMGNYSKALDLYRRSLLINERAGNLASLADNYGNIATAYDEQQDTLYSRYYYRKNLELAKKISYDWGIVSAEINLGISYTNTNNFDSALHYLIYALQKIKARNDKLNQSIVLEYFAYCYMNAPDAILKKAGLNVYNKLQQAEQFQLQGIKLSKQANDLRGLIEHYQNLSDIYVAQTNYKKALEAYKESVTYKDSTLNDDTKQQITRLEMQYQFSKTQDSIEAINDKKQIVAAAQIQKQRIVKNATMTGAGFLMLAGIGAFIFYKRNRDIRTKQQEVELKQQITDVEMKALRAQMNPHFIFNSLNSIADYIDKNQTKIAADFTTKFAKLMRIVLENSEQKEIPLADDLKALELYMQLESLRLNNKFSYEIIVDKAIDKENTLVPPLILQPFVENSIWHGVAKQEHGNITINILKDDGMIHCIVDDNGSGISNAEFVNREKKSLGMRITKARIDIINKIKNANASMNIYNKEKGVRAEVKLPLEMSF